MDKSQIIINNLNFKYNEQIVLDNINLQISQIDYLVITGKNGSGKSTLIKCLLGLNKIDNQIITIDGVSINKLDKKGIFGYVAQESKLLLDIPITAVEYLKLYKSDIKKIKEVLKTINAKYLENKQLNDMSGGERQRIFIAKSLLNNIKFLILDEPIKGLDKAMRKSFHDLTNTLHKNGVGIIIISHNLEELDMHITKVYDLEERKLSEFNRTNCKYC